jgi:outer membrane receptor protein involved in Fe transport
MATVVYAAPVDQIQGTIKDALGRPLSEADLVLQSPDGTVAGRTKSDAEGRFVFSKVAPGSYAVLAEKPGFQASTAVVTVEAGRLATTTLTMAAQEALELKVEAERLNQARNSLSPTTGGSVYSFDQTAISELPQGQNTPFNQMLLQAPGVANDSFGQLHVRGDHANIQYRIDGVILPEGITGFGQVLDTRFASSVDLLDGALPAQFGLRTAGVIEITTKTHYETEGEVEMYGGSRGTVEPNLEFGGSEGKMNYFATGSFTRDNLGIENPTPSSNALHDTTVQDKGFAYMSYLFNPSSRLIVMFSEYDGKFQIPDNPGQSPLPLPFTRPPGYTSFNSADLNERQNETNRFAVLAYQSSVGDFDNQVSFVSRYTNVHFIPDPLGDLILNGVASNVFDSSYINQLQDDASYRLNDSHTLHMGLSGSYEDTKSLNTSTVFPNPVSGTVYGLPETIVDNEPKNGNTLFSAYLDDEWKFAEKWTLNYGLRYDYMNSYVSAEQLSPRIGAVYKVTPDTTLHAGYARYFTPPPTELISATTVALYNHTSNEATVPSNSAVLPERSHYFDVGAIQKVTPNLTVGVDTYYKITTDLIDEGQFGQALIYSPFNYAQGRIEGLETTVNYKLGNFSTYGNLAVTESLGKDVVSGQFNFTQAELDYIANNWIHCDHDQWYTASGGVSYNWLETLLTADATYGSGLRSGFANTETVPPNFQLNLGAKRKFDLKKCGLFHGPIEVRVAILNVTDRVNEIRTGSGIGVFAPQYGPRIGFFSGIKYIF